MRQTLLAVGEGERQYSAFVNCGAQCIVEFCADEQKYRLRADYCKCRHCEPCARAKAGLMAANLRKRLETRPKGRYRLVTLTLLHSNTPLVNQIRRLYKSFSDLRNRILWKRSQHGGVAIMECKWDKKTRHWHPHLHCITEGAFMHQRDLAGAWHEITGDSFIVDIRELSSEKDAAHYVSKYVSKGTNGEVWHDRDAAQEWVTAMKGVRTAATFGDWRGFKLLGHDKDERNWTRVSSLREVILAARTGEAWAKGCLQNLIEHLQHNPGKPRARKPLDDITNSS